MEHQAQPQAAPVQDHHETLEARVAQLERDVNLVNRKLEAAGLHTVNPAPSVPAQPATSTQVGQPTQPVGADGRPLPNVQTPSPAPVNPQAQPAPNMGAGDANANK
jgi:hypothetical protein